MTGAVALWACALPGLAQNGAPPRPATRPADLVAVAAPQTPAPGADAPAPSAEELARAAAEPASEDVTDGLTDTADMVPAVAVDPAATAPVAAGADSVAPAVAAPPLPGNCPATGPDVVLGAETCLPLPRFVSLKTDEGNARRGPSLSHRIDWVFVREDMPLMITAEYGHWRRVMDRDGVGGWVHYTLLSGSRTAVVASDLQPLLARADAGAQQLAQLEAGVIARLESCVPDWCRINAGGYEGWVPKSAIWGVGADEVLD